MRRRRTWLWLTGLVVLGLFGCWWADRLLKQRDHPGLITFISQWSRNYPKSFSVEPPLIAITVDDVALEQLESVVRNARERGVIMPEGNDYVDARCDAGSGSFKARIRIKGKLTDHVKGRKWSFRVLARKEGGFLGMKRFSLQHPGTRNYLCDWLYHQLSRGLGIVALRYGFCRVTLNGDDLGIYAYEEHFGPALLEHNGRLPGPILRFDPGLYWVHRLNRMVGRTFDEAYADYQAAAVDAYDTEDMVKDPDQLRYFQQALALLDGFRRGTLKASQVFDIERMAARHALIDLVGGHHSMDWSDVKYYFDPVAQKLEPVSYESFSAFPTRELAGAYRLTGPANERDDLHDQLFKDPDFFRAYMHQVERLSRKDWLDSSFAVLAGALDAAAATMYREFPYKELDRGIYYRNQEAMRRMLDVPKGLHAYVQHAGGDTLRLALVPVNSLPVEVEAVVLADGRELRSERMPIVPARPRGALGAPVEFALAAPSVTDSLVKKGLTVRCRILGASQMMDVEVFPFPLPGSQVEADLLALRAPNLDEFPFFLVDEVSREIFIRPGTWKVDRDIIIPEGHRVIARDPFTLDLTGGAMFISRSAISFKGNDERGIVIMSSDSSSRGFHLLDTRTTSTLENVRFEHLMRYAYEQPFRADVSFHRSNAQMTGCTFTGMGATLLDLSLCKSTLSDCRFDGGSDQVETHHATLVVNGGWFANAADDAMSVSGGSLDLRDARFNEIKGIGLKATTSARLKATGVVFTNVEQTLEAREGSEIVLSAGSITGGSLTAEAKKDEMRYGPTRIEFTNVQLEEARELFKVGEGSTIIVDGRKLSTPRK